MKFIASLFALALVGCAQSPAKNPPTTVDVKAGGVEATISSAAAPRCPGPACNPPQGDLWGACKADLTCNSPALQCKSKDGASVCVGGCDNPGGPCTTKDCGLHTCRQDKLCAMDCPCQPGMVCDESSMLCMWLPK